MKSRLKTLSVIILVSLLYTNVNALEINLESYQAQWADRRANNIGDIVTVLINESAKASSSAGLNAENKNSVNAGLIYPDDNFKTSLGFGGSLQGDASTTRNGAIKATITTRIVDIDRYGLLKIEGSQFVTVNGEEQEIELSGYIRGEDLSTDNIILSNRIESARIELSGIGEVTDNRHPSVFRTMFRWLGF